MKTLISFIVSLIISTSAFASNPLLPFGIPIMNGKDQIRIGVTATRTDTSWNKMSSQYLFAGTLHKTFDEGVIASVFVDEYKNKFINENNKLVSSLRSMPVLKPGAYMLYFRLPDGEFVKHRVTLKNSSAVLELYTTDQIPIVDVLQKISFDKDVSKEEADMIYRNHKETVAHIEIEQLEKQ